MTIMIYLQNMKKLKTPGYRFWGLAFSIIPLILTLSCQQGQDSISLEGTWEFQVDSLDEGINESWYLNTLEDRITLPGSMTENGKGNEIRLDMKWTGSIYDSSWYFRPEMAKYRESDNLKFPMWLTPLKYYVGAAWYRKEFNAPKNWEGRRIVLFLERVHTESRLWIDGNEVGMQNSLVAPHEYELSETLSPGKHTISLCIDNRIKEINVGPDSHSITDHTQGNWNGVIGKMEIRSMPPAWIDEVQVYPEPGNESARVRIRIGNQTGLPVSGEINMAAKSFNTTQIHRVPSSRSDIRLLGTEKWIELILPMGKDFQAWDEFNPVLYNLEVKLRTKGKYKHTKEVQFGMRSFHAEGRRFTINGRPVFLRGNVDCAAFPLTGYPPMDVASWMDLFTVLKNYGLNHVRYHSWCPPEAAFIAADRKGIYLQPEGPSWANHGVSLGDGLPIDQYIYDETHRMEKHYGNYASFVMMAYGNEPAGRHQAEYLGEFVKHWKERDTRRVYTGASVGSRWPDVPEAEFIVKSRPRGLPWKRSMPNSLFDHRRIIQAESVPYVAHESGQYCVFPDFKEIEKYTGVMRARNFELFRELLEDHDMGMQAEDFLMASGKLQLLCYKHEVEAALRTPEFGGFQLLSLNDFPGQGTALIGIVNSMYEDKGYGHAEDFSRFCSPTVPLARIPKFVFTNDETFHAELELSHFGPKALKNSNLIWEIRNSTDSILKSGSLEIPIIPINNTLPAGDIDFDLSAITEPDKLNLEVRLESTSSVNDWNFWVYPFRLPEPDTQNIYICRELDKGALKVLEKGGDVLVLGAGKIEYGKDVIMHFMPVFWNTSWFQMRPPHVTGILCDPEHPVFKEFPTSFHSDLQWWEIQHGQQVMQLDDFPEGFKPLIQPIDTWFLSRKLGVLFEARVENGRIIVCSLDLTSAMDKRPVARQLLYSIKNYMNSQEFNPGFSIEPALITKLFAAPEGPGFESFTNSSTDDLIPVTK